MWFFVTKVDRLVDCVDCFTDLLTYHHHRQHTITPKESSLAEVSTHRILYMGLVHTLTSFLTMMPLDMVSHTLSIPNVIQFSFRHLLFFFTATNMNVFHFSIYLSLLKFSFSQTLSLF